MDNQPRYQFIGHIHSGHGTIKVGGTTYVNISLCSEDCEAVNAPVVMEIEGEYLVYLPYDVIGLSRVQI